MAREINPDDVFLNVLCHNSLSITKTFLDKIYKYTDPEKLWLFIIDNGSSDDTPQYLEEIADEKSNMEVLLLDYNSGVIGGRNIGFEHFIPTEAKYLMFLDNDQFVREGWLEQHVGVLEQGYDLIGVEAWQMSPTFLPVRRCASLSQSFTYVGCGGSLMRRAVTEVLGGYDEQFNPSYFEDPDLCWRAHKAGFKIGWNMTARIDHLPHQTLGSMEDKNQRFINSLTKFRKKWRGYRAPSFRQKMLPEFSSD